MVRLPLLLALLLVLPGASAGDYGAGGEPATGYHTQKKMTRAADGSLYSTYLEDERVVVARLAPDGSR
ncbi:MAG TPA: hypothetical protein VM582_07435, partial [Candidatus Thermoplasmatota archaeon]|nr:hypothetical protein [Candidatus Thermoplasmatota archaeon]